ncbi:M56 family metallopeptidase [uncultured Paludibaculum sp.]|uniref:M56 family metallopeptidase n=1 Tax=uncultured Paludibaculum sp. TaxID=1765020 RepID=UPI002AABC904|nr:M56 family metallopeptidase [uncultured Paludibaculum sp.]
MITGSFLIEWAIRSSVLIGSGAVLLWLLRVKDPSIRLAACIAAVCGSLAMPWLGAAFPKLPVVVMQAPAVATLNPTAPIHGAASGDRPAHQTHDGVSMTGRDWSHSVEGALGARHLRSGTGPGRAASPAWAAGRAMRDSAEDARSPSLTLWDGDGGAASSGLAARGAMRDSLVGLYALIAGLLLLRLGMGLLLARKLRLQSRATELTAGGAEVRESLSVTSPVTVGLARPVILLPADWRAWGPAKLDAVLAHEQSHVRRKDPAVQFLSAMHRALLWHSPLSWALHRNIVRLAEDVSDDAAVAATRDRTSYAEMLLEFMQGGVRVNWHGAAMARYGSADARIHRILNSTILSTGLTRGAVAVICLLAVPLAYVTAAAIPSRAVRAVSNTSVAAGSVAAMASAGPSTVAEDAQGTVAQTSATSSSAGHARSEGAYRRYIIVLGDTQSGSWDSSDPVNPETLRSRFGRRFAWFRQGGAEHVVTDAGVLQDIERAMEPQKKVNAQQDQVNRLQSTVNGLQGKVNAQQNDVNGVQDKVNAQQAKVNAAQSMANKRQDLLNRIHDAGSRDNNEAAARKLEALLKELRATPDSSGQDEVNRLQSKVNEEQGRVNGLQGKVNAEQDKVNAEQQKVNVEQGKVNEVQRRVSAEFNTRIQEIFDSAIRRGLTKSVQ